MKPWQIMTLYAISSAIVASILGAIFPAAWTLIKIAGVVFVVLVGRKVL